MKRGIISATRENLDLNLNVKMGQIPLDMYGFLYVALPVGSVNSGGLPFFQKLPDGSINPEFGTPIMNGDGYTICLDFSEQGQVTFKSALIKTPCFYADQATRMDADFDPDKKDFWKFRNFGISRISLVLGARNLLNTAFIPFRFAKDKYPRLLATYDVGRPFEIDPQKLELITPIGKNSEWLNGTPPMIRFPFGLVQATAHPVFDPKTKDLFMVNFTKSVQSLISSINLLEFLKLESTESEQKLEKFLEDLLQQKKSKADAKQDIENYLFDLQKNSVKTSNIWQKIWDFFKNIFGRMTGLQDELYLLKWTGEGALKKWRLVDEKNQNIIIKQCIHQISISEDYIILIDSSFKFTLDILVNNPFPNNPNIDRLLRLLLTAPMEPFTTCYIVDRRDLKDNKKTAFAKKTKQPLPLETVHFSANYSNPDNQITLYASHNSAACLAEWLRPYDLSKINPGPIDSSLISLFAIGDMDIGRAGKYKIDAKTGEIIEEEICLEAGQIIDGKWKGEGHTWGISLYAYRDMIDPNKTVDQIQNIYFLSYGMDPRMLSEFIFDLYKDYPNRSISVDDVLNFTRIGVPNVLIRMNTNTMKIEDSFEFPDGFYLRSLQFVPKKDSQSGLDSYGQSMDGYIVCAMSNKSQEDPEIYVPEFWIFDASDLQRGQICQLGHPDLDFSFSLHTTWMAEAQNPTSNYKIDIKEDYDQVINKIIWPAKRKEVRHFFEKYIYPHF